MPWNSGKKWEPTEDQLRQIQALAGFGSPLHEIAAIIGISDDTLQRAIKKSAKKGTALHAVIKKGRAEINANVARSLYRQAVGGETRTIFDKNGKKIEVKTEPNVSAAIFWAKTRMRWRETAPEGEETETERVVIILPENGRETKK